MKLHGKVDEIFHELAHSGKRSGAGAAKEVQPISKEIKLSHIIVFTEDCNADFESFLTDKLYQVVENTRHTRFRKALIGASVDTSEQSVVDNPVTQTNGLIQWKNAIYITTMTG
jgi:hypothetical protein